MGEVLNMFCDLNLFDPTVCKPIPLALPGGKSVPAIGALLKTKELVCPVSSTTSAGAEGIEVRPNIQVVVFSGDWVGSPSHWVSTPNGWVRLRRDWVS